MVNMDSSRKTELQEIARKIRVGIIDAVYSANSGHPGGSLSIADVLAYLYFEEMNVDPKNPQWPGRDRLVLSKGHCAPGLYSALAQRGYFPVEDLKTFRKTSSYLQGHPDMKHTPGVDMTSGSLGQGASTSCGMALANKLDKTSVRVYAILGDGETEEGQVWEAAMFANQYHLDNLTVLLDYNKQQIDGPVDSVMSPGDPLVRWSAFGFDVREADGHDVEAIEDALLAARQVKGKPQLIVMHTTKGKGVSLVENTAFNHYMTITPEQVQSMLAELSE